MNKAEQDKADLQEITKPENLVLLVTMLEFALERGAEEFMDLSHRGRAARLVKLLNRVADDGTTGDEQ